MYCRKAFCFPAKCRWSVPVTAPQQCVFYPLTRKPHQEGILRMSVAFPQTQNPLQTQAEQMLGLSSLSWIIPRDG